ncbi:MAG: adenylate/guanylate cyclase domain-containing protein [Gammaproteobacteria bacterium]|nr:adenylate/guanylate cyclase domain-containing protein [Gammaproteobacteria bacterium]
MPRWLKGLGVGVATGLIGVILTLIPVGTYFEQNVGLAWLFKVRGAIEPPPNVAVVAINDRATEGLGLPALPRDWPRSIHARLIESLVERGASVIVFDLDFKRPKEAQHDVEFAKAVADSGRVVLFERLEGKRQPVFDVNGKQTGTIWAEELIPPIPALAEAAKGLAPFPVPKVQVNIFQFWTFKPSADDAATMPAVALQVYALGVYERWLEILQQFDPAIVDDLPRHSSELVHAADLRNVMRRFRRSFKNDLSLGETIDAALSAEPDQGTTAMEDQLVMALAKLYQSGDNPYLNFYGPPGSIPTIPYKAVITGSDPNIDPAALDFTNKVVFVGFSDLFDPGQPDRFYTVFTRSDGVDLSGVEIAATGFGNLLTDRTLKPSNTATTTAILLLFGIILGAGIYLLPALAGVPLALLLSGLYVFGVQFAFNSTDVWLPLATPVLVQLPMALFIGLFGQYLLERRKEKLISKAVSYYLPENIAKELTEKELDPSSLNKVVYGACLATDMSGFTTISETMAPSELASFMNRYFDALAHALKQHKVDVTEFHADTIMCAWTADEPEALDRHNAALASLAVVDAVDRFNKETEDVNLNARIGLEEGHFYLGHTGGGGRMGYSILGDCANTAARLESLNKHLGTHILASDPVVKKPNGLLTRPLGRFILVGKADPISIVEILAADGSANKSQVRLRERFTQALGLFEKQQWSEAANHFEAVLKDYPEDGPSRFYLNLCREYQTQPPISEDPSVIRMDAK